MKITFAPRGFFTDRALNLRQFNHFLLAGARVEITLVFEDSTEKIFAPPRKSGGLFVLDLKPADIPDVASSNPPVKKRISGLSLDFRVPYRQDHQDFLLLRIIQDFFLSPSPANSDQNIDYLLSPFSWKHSAFALTNRRTSPNRTANARVHPLLDLTKLSENLILINTLVLDITELWDMLHERNTSYRVYKTFSPADKVTFKVFAHTGGIPFIWYGVVPAYLSEAKAVSPHIFFSPADLREKQNLANEEKYLRHNRNYFDRESGGYLINTYLLPPVDDEAIQDVSGFPERPPALRLDWPPPPVGFDLPDTPIDRRSFLREGRRRSRLIDWVIEFRRNVVTFSYTDSRKRKITPHHWNISAGFERAFYAFENKAPQQFLLIPQGRERGKHLKVVTDSILDLLQTNTELIGHADDELVEKDKMVISCYSESGPDLYLASKANLENLKAIIGIEPNWINRTGDRKGKPPAIVGSEIIPTLLDNQVRVFIIGRHIGFADHYHPQIETRYLDQIRFMPKDPVKLLQYRPDPDTNYFVKYRIFRMTDPELDPLMLPEEKEILEEFAKRKPPVKGKGAIPLILQTINNSDKLSDGALNTIFYTHHFALTGGEIMHPNDLKYYDPQTGQNRMPPDSEFYKTPVYYQTFFQEAVEEIG